MGRLAEQLGLSETDVAWGIHDVVNENMASAARVHIAEQGKDPRGFTLLATGGAGPVHAFYVARKLGLKRILCPVAAGVASALGLLIAPARVDRVATVAVQWDAIDWPALEQDFRALEKEAAAVIAETGLDAEAAEVTRLADMRYVGQGFEIVVTLPAGPYDASSAAAVEAAFTETYRRTFSRTPPEGRIEIINIRVSLRAQVPGARHRLCRRHGRRRGGQGHAQGLLPRSGRLRRDQGLRPRVASRRRQVRRPGDRRGGGIDPGRRPERDDARGRERQPDRGSGGWVGMPDDVQKTSPHLNPPPQGGRTFVVLFAHFATKAPPPLRGRVGWGVT